MAQWGEQYLRATQLSPHAGWRQDRLPVIGGPLALGAGALGAGVLVSTRYRAVSGRGIVRRTSHPLFSLTDLMRFLPLAAGTAGLLACSGPKPLPAPIPALEAKPKTAFALQIVEIATGSGAAAEPAKWLLRRLHRLGCRLRGHASRRETTTHRSIPASLR